MTVNVGLTATAWLCESIRAAKLFRREFHTPCDSSRGGSVRAYLQPCLAFPFWGVRPAWQLLCQTTHSGFYDINEATLDENLNLSCNSYSVLWDKQPDANGFKNCNITGLKLQRKTVESLLKEDSQKEIPLDKDVVQKAKP